jgi:hypothetical protein
VIVSGNYNEHKYDRTKWYSISDESICEKYKIHFTKPRNVFDETAEPIPVSKPISKPVNYEIDFSIINEVAYKEWIEYRKQIKKPMPESTVKMQTKMLMNYSMQEQKDIIERSIAN